MAHCLEIGSVKRFLDRGAGGDHREYLVIFLDHDVDHSGYTG